MEMLCNAAARRGTAAFAPVKMPSGFRSGTFDAPKSASAGENPRGILHSWEFRLQLRLLPLDLRVGSPQE
jgi:hypothetical protein